MRLVIKTIVGFIVLVGGLLLIGVVLDAADTDKEIRPWVASGLILFFLVSVVLAVVMRKRRRLAQPMATATGDPRFDQMLAEVTGLLRELGGYEPSDQRIITTGTRIAAVSMGAYAQHDGPLPCTGDSVREIERMYNTKPALAALRTEAFIVAVGAFVGECIRQRHGGTWVHDPTFAWPWVLKVSDRLTCNPLGKVEKFFTIGPEESMDGFVRTTTAMLADQASKP